MPSNLPASKAKHPKLLFPSNVHDVHDHHPRLLLLCTSVLSRMSCDQVYLRGNVSHGHVRHTAKSTERRCLTSPRMSLRQRSFGCHTRNYLAAMAAVNPEILVGRQDDGISKRFGHANQACIGEAHRNV